MMLNLNDPESIVGWWQVLPERHDSYLEYKLRASPEFAPAILEARRRIANAPDLRGLLIEAGRHRRQFEQADRYMSAYEQTRAELAVA